MPTPQLASTVVDLNALTATGRRRPVCRDRSGAGRAAADAERRKKWPGLTRPYRYNELIGTQGGLTALHFAARQGAARSVAALVDGGVAR